jgi:hypothetical protein
VGSHQLERYSADSLKAEIEMLEKGSRAKGKGKIKAREEEAIDLCTESD